MNRMVVTFCMIDTGQVAPVGNNRTSGRVIFDVKIEFTRKYIWACMLEYFLMKVLE